MDSRISLFSSLTQIIHSIKRKVFYGWWIVALGSLINAVGPGVFHISFTVFFLPLKRDFGVSSAAISLLYGAARLEGGFEGPLIGYLINRFGPRAMIVAGASMAGIGLILLSLVDSFWSFFFIYIFIASVGANAGFYHPVSTAVNNWFIRHRGVGFSCLSASINIGGMILAPILSYIILTSGWRVGAVTAGIIILIIALPSALPIYRSPEVVGLHPDGQALQSQPFQPLGKEVADFDFTIKAALQTGPFWLLMTTISLRLFVTVGLNTHFVPILVWKGMSEVGAAYLVSLLSFISILTSLAMGWMGDRWNKCLLSSLGIVPTIVAMVGLIFSQATPILYLLSIGLAITMGTAPLNWALIGDFFGRRSYATLRGIMGVGHGVATFISPVIAGWIFDLTESYTLVLLTFSIILTSSALFFACLRRPSPIAKKK